MLPCDCCDVTVEVLGCCPVSIPQQDVTLNYTGTGFAGSGSITMAYTPEVGATPAVWSGPCLDVGTINPAGTPFHGWIKFFLSCSTAGQTTTRFSLYKNGTCTGTPEALSAFFGIDSFGSTPFHLHHAVTGFDTILNAAGFTAVDHDSPVNAAGACKYIFSVTGCNFIFAPGVSISAWTSSAKTTLLGTLVGSGTIVSTERTTNGHYEITGSRFESVSGDGLLASATDTNSFNLTPTSDYQCDAGFCGWPIAGTLHGTHPVFGAVTLTYSSGHWTGSAVYSYPGNTGSGGTCSAGTVTVNFDMGGDYSYTESWLYDGSDCPTDSGTNTATAFWTFESVDCYSPGVTAFSANFSKTPFAGPQQNIYGSSFMNLSYTE